MTENIMKDNLMYLEAWMNYNPSLKENLRIDRNFLIYKEQEKIDISNFYLPDMLYNINFREKVASELNSEDLFQIIKIYIQTNEITTQEEKEMTLLVKEVLIKKDNLENEFVMLIDEKDKKYRYDTDSPEKVINYFNEMKKQKGQVTLKELGKVIQNGN